jgi:hypothetical protein
MNAHTTPSDIKVDWEKDSQYEYLLELMRKNLTRTMLRRTIPKEEKWSTVISKVLFKKK